MNGRVHDGSRFIPLQGVDPILLLILVFSAQQQRKEDEVELKRPS
jgi:hypothetical protein